MSSFCFIFRRTIMEKNNFYYLILSAHSTARNQILFNRLPGLSGILNDPRLGPLAIRPYIPRIRSGLKVFKCCT